MARTGAGAVRAIAGEPVARTNLADALIERILRHIRQERLSPGDRLPSTRDMAARFSVATPTLREALRRLEATGAVEIRHGSGVYVRGDLTRLIMTNPHQSPLAAETVVELLEAREVLEPPLAEAATRSATDDQLAALTAALEQAETALGSDVALHAANVEFHRAIGRSSGNAVLAQVICSLMDIYGQEQRAILNLYGDRVRDYHAHRAILAAMRARQPLRARRLMSEHLRDVRTVVTRALARKGSSNRT